MEALRVFIMYDIIKDDRKGIFDKAASQWEKSLELDPEQKDVKEKLEKLRNPTLPRGE